MNKIARWDPQSNPLHKAVLRYIENKWPIIPLWWIEDGRCACRNLSCSSPGKHPIHYLVPHGIKNATLDRDIASRWWSTHSNANIGIALGRVSHLAVIDVDGLSGRVTLERLLAKHQHPMRSAWFVETGREDGGRHYYFRCPADLRIATKKFEGLEVRGEGAYVVAPPSIHYTGNRYRWENIPNDGSTLDDLPECFLAFSRYGEKAIGATKKDRLRQSTDRSFTGVSIRMGSFYSPPTWSHAEETRVIAALNFIPSDDREIWLRAGMALHWTTWGRAKEIWDRWSAKSTKYDVAGQDKAWGSFGRQDYNGAVVTLGSLFDMAKRHGYETPIEPPTKSEETTANKSLVEQVNAKHFMIRNIGGKCLIGEMIENPAGSGQMLSLQSVESFRSWYANKFVVVQDSQGNAKQKHLGAYWLEHHDRRGYEGVDLVPNEPQEMPNGMLNLWRGFGVEPKQGDWQLMRRHVCFVLASRDRKAAEYILRWAAWSVQHPGERAEVALVLQGGKGCGKGVFIRAIARCFGEHGLQITNQEHLLGKFNGHLRSCLLLFADEAFWAGNKKGESILKGLITEPVLMIEQKGIDAIQWRNRLHVVMAANADWVVPASAGERRYAVFKCADTYVMGHSDEAVRESYFKALHNELEDGGLEAMLFDMLHWNLGDWHPRQIYETDGLLDQKQYSLPPLEEWLSELLQEGKLPGSGLSDATNRKNFSSTRALIEDAKLRVPKTTGWLSDKALSLFLRKEGCNPVKDRCGRIETRGWRFPSLIEMRKNWSKRYGGWKWNDPEQEEWQ